MPRIASPQPQIRAYVPLDVPATVVLAVSEPSHLFRLQTATRGFCRSLGLDESAVFEAVISVTELAHRLFVERSRPGSIELSAVRHGGRLELEVRADDAVVSLNH